MKGSKPTGSTAGAESPQELRTYPVDEAIIKLLQASKGECDAHVFETEGRLLHFAFTQPGEPLPEELASLAYSGTIGPERARAFADIIMAQEVDA